MSAMRIDRGIPIPANKPKYPLRRMRVGDSFFVSKSAGLNAPHCVRTCADYVRRSVAGFAVTVRSTKTGWRIWRTA